MTDRVRAILITQDARLLTIKRVRPGTPLYWILPGGGVEAGDASLEDALRRELREEPDGEADIVSLVQVVDQGDHRQLIYLARPCSYDFANRTGPEFSDPSRGEHILDEVPFTGVGLSRINLVPAETAVLLRRLAATGQDPFELPDRRR